MTSFACITGMGCVCATGSDPKSAWDGLLHGARRRTPASVLAPEALDFPFFAAPPEAFGEGRRMSAADTLSLARFALGQALSQAQLTPDARLGIVLGTTAGSALHFLRGYAASRAGVDCQFADREEYFTSNLALNLALELNATGPALTVSNACTSGADALGMGLDLLRQDACDAVLCGGADALSVVPHTGFARLMIYDSEACRPFDVNRRGLNLGEGAAVFVLEKEERAQARGAAVLGRILGYGAACDAHHFTAPHPEARGLRDAVRMALDDAGVKPSDLAFVNAHGTGTAENDKVEGGFFQRELPELPVWASKGCTGHTLGAAGALEAFFCVQALRCRILPQSFGFSQMDPAIGLCPTREALPVRGAYALSTSIGFGGGNAALVLEGIA